jgi:LAS superfamily LD-carboxypeptidase LdcB
MTQQDGAPLTRRALRTQAAPGTPAATPPTPGTPSATQDGSPAAPTARPLTRRELRLADAGLLHAPADALPAPATPLPPATAGPRPTAAHGATSVPAAATPASSDRPASGAVTTDPSSTDRPLTRRELRLRDRAQVPGGRTHAGSVASPPVATVAPGTTASTGPSAGAVTPAEAATACRPPFTASLVLPAEHPGVLDAPAGDATVRRAASAASPGTSVVAPAAPGPAHRGSSGPASRRDGRSPATGGPVHSSRRLLGHVARKPFAVVALSAGLLTVGVTQVHAEQGIVAQARAAAESARNALERQERSDSAAADRLTAQAAAHAAAQRTQALAAAEAAVAAAHGAKEVAAPVLDAETVSRLEAAAEELAALLEATPAPPLPTATEATDGAPEEAGAAPLAAGGEPGTARVDQPSRSVPAEGRPPLPTQAAAPATTEEAPADQGADAADPTEAAPGPDASVEAGSDAAADPTDPAVEQDAAAGAALPVQELVEALPDLDIEVTRRIQERAEEVAALTAEVQGLADAKIAEAVAAAAAAEQARLEAEAAAAAAAAELARKVAVAEAAGNGDIPADVLCGVGFTEGVQLRCDAAAALEELNAAYRADFGRDLDVVSSYRSYSQQVAVKRTRGGLAAQPGTSNHGRGVAVDFGGFGGLGNFSTANYRWMKANGERFGWYHPRIMQPGGGGPQEPWHWEFGTDS